MRCIVYDFFGGFDKWNVKDEEGKEVPDLGNYYEF
jgi:hypothetical protein